MSGLLAAAVEAPAFEPAVVTGAPWNPDWRDQAPLTPDYQGFGGVVAYLNLDGPTEWNPYFGLAVADPVILGYGGSELLQAEPMGELRAGSTIGWPTSGQEGPNSEVPILDLANEAGVDVGLQLWGEPGPRMIFAPPPSYGAQTVPIPAVGV